MMQVIDFNRTEWRRMAADAAAKGRTFWQERYLRFADMDALPIRTWDDAQNYYRAWLVFGWAEVDRMAARDEAATIAQYAG